VHEICLPNQEAEIASIVAVTRTSETVAAITKVYTNRQWRQRGCAERLTRRVCKEYVLSI
jgi:predicted GNAT family acetyltransferase